MTAHQVDRVEEARMTPSELAALRVELESWTTLIGVRRPVASVSDVELGPGLGARVYRPSPVDDCVLVWFHGGGYVAGSLEAIDPTCRWLAARIGCTVVSVDYRLAPEHPFPAGVEDAVSAVSAVAAWSGVSRVAVGGDSAGGGLAAAVAVLSDVPLAGMLLLCPWLDLTVRDTGVPSELTLEQLQSFAALYVGPEGDVTDPRASPSLGPVPQMPVVIVAAEQDSLGYQAVEYAARLSQVEIRRWPHDHGFVGFTKDLPAAGEALDWAAEALCAVPFRAVLGSDR